MTDPLINKDGLAEAIYAAFDDVAGSDVTKHVLHYLRSVLTSKALNPTQEVLYGEYIIKHAASGADMYRRIFGEDT